MEVGYQQAVKRALHIVLLPALILVSGPLRAAEIAGRVVGDHGTPLAGVRVSLGCSNDQNECPSITSTNKQGHYAFRALSGDGPYAVEVLAGGIASDCDGRNKTSNTRRRPGRTSRANQAQIKEYQSYIWSPERSMVELSSEWDQVGELDFVGTFGFTNFQRSFCLSGSRFPELSSFDVLGDIVFLKVYVIDPADQVSQELIYLGQVTSIYRLLVEISVPLTTEQLHYEIFSATHAASGSISLHN